MRIGQGMAAGAVWMLVGGAIGCSSGPPPKELLDARSAYLRAQSGPANQMSPASLHEAKVALDKAEQTYADDGNGQKARDVAYVAERKAELAEVDAATLIAKRDQQQAADLARVNQADAVTQAQGQLAQTQQQLSATGQQLAATGQALDAEKTARKDAEKRARETMDKLVAANAAAVKDEPRGTVITLSGSVLFTSAKAELLPAAQKRLDQVADALKDQSDHQIVVEGHTDAQGTEASNLDLSQRRAQAVRDYLVSRGVAEDHIKAMGLGQTRPIADNKSAEGRANNRRVEIVIQPGEKR